MKKKELIAAISKRSGMAKTDSEKALNAVTDCLTELLCNGDSIILPGFASFSIKKRAARTGRNPSNGQPLHIPASKIVSFRAGSKLKKEINA